MLESGAAIPYRQKVVQNTLNRLRATALSILLSASAKRATRLFQLPVITGLRCLRAELPKKMVLVLGQESDGLSDAAISSADLNIAIEGTGNVESLNVSVATGVLLAEWWRQNKV